MALDGEHRAAEEARNALSLSERKRIALQTELEDVRALLENVSLNPLACIPITIYMHSLGDDLLDNPKHEAFFSAHDK